MTGSEGDRLYVAHWSGTAWREVPAPPVTAPPGEEDGEVYFRDFVTVSPRERWALITASSDVSYRTLIYRHRGGAWHEVAGPDLGGHDPVLGSLAVDDRGEAWLTTTSNLVFRRVDQRWQQSALSHPGGGTVELDDISVAGGVARVTGLIAYDDDGFEFDAVIYRAGAPSTESPSPEPTRTTTPEPSSPSASSSASAEPSPPATTPSALGSPSEPPGGLPVTGNRAGVIIGSGFALLLAGAALLWFGRRRWQVWRAVGRR